MSAALMALVLALFAGQPFAPADVAATGITVTVRDSLTDRHPTAIGWTWCGGPVCKIEVRGDLGDDGPRVLRHEVCHALDWLTDGAADGSIAGWQPWAGEPYAGPPLSDAERLGYWCGVQEVRG